MASSDVWFIWTFFVTDSPEKTSLFIVANNEWNKCRQKAKSYEKKFLKITSKPWPGTQNQVRILQRNEIWLKEKILLRTKKVIRNDLRSAACLPISTNWQGNNLLRYSSSGTVESHSRSSGRREIQHKNHVTLKNFRRSRFVGYSWFE